MFLVPVAAWFFHTDQNEPLTITFLSAYNPAYLSRDTSHKQRLSHARTPSSQVSLHFSTYILIEVWFVQFQFYDNCLYNCPLLWSAALHMLWCYFIWIKQKKYKADQKTLFTKKIDPTWQKSIWKLTLLQRMLTVRVCAARRSHCWRNLHLNGVKAKTTTSSQTCSLQSLAKSTTWGKS